MADVPHILIVRHGPGRSGGRMPDYLRSTLDLLGERHPDVSRRLRLHDTGTGSADLTGIAAVVFWLGDPLRELYPDCYAEAMGIASESRRRGLPLVNPPESLSNSVKSVQSRLWADAGIPTPIHRRFQARDELQTALEGLSFPVILRADELHCQEGMHILDGPAELSAFSGKDLLFPGSVTPLVDTRESYRTVRPDTIWSDLYHKKRVYVLGGRVETVHLFFSESPIVSQGNSTLRRIKHAKRWLPRSYRRMRKRFDPTVEADREFFWSDPDEPELMTRAAAALGFGWVAIDYASFADGRVMLWEANPYFALPPFDENPLPRRRGLKLRHLRLNDVMADFFRRLTG